MKVFVAEFIGTFALVFVGAAAGLNYNSIGVFGIALAHGLTMAVFIYCFGHISGAHINSAVTLGLVANGNIKWRDAVVYWIAQLSGASIAAFALRLIFSHLGEFTPAATYGSLIRLQLPFHAMALEALLTFFLMNSVLHAVVDGKAGLFGGWVVGTTLTVAVLMGGTLTGASLNPARSFGPALFLSTINFGTKDFLNPTFYLIYFMGPFIGAVLATMLYRYLKLESDVSEETGEEVVAFDEPAQKPAARKIPARKTTKK